MPAMQVLQCAALTLKASPTGCCRLASLPACLGSASDGEGSHAEQCTAQHMQKWLDTSTSTSKLRWGVYKADLAALHIHAGGLACTGCAGCQQRGRLRKNILLQPSKNMMLRQHAMNGSQRTPLTLLSSVSEPSVDELLLLRRRTTAGLPAPAAGCAMLPSAAWLPPPVDGLLVI